MSLDKNMDFQTDGQFDMTNLSTEKIMNKITKIAKKKKKIKLIKPKKEESDDEEEEEEDVEYWNRVEYYVMCDVCGTEWDKKHDHKLVGALCHSWAYQRRAFCCPSCIDDGKCRCAECEEEEEICCKCETDCDVWKCMECDKFICIECDPNEMATYTYNGAGIHCEPCAIANGFALGALG